MIEPKSTSRATRKFGNRGAWQAEADHLRAHPEESFVIERKPYPNKGMYALAAHVRSGGYAAFKAAGQFDAWVERAGDNLEVIAVYTAGAHLAEAEAISTPTGDPAETVAADPTPAPEAGPDSGRPAHTIGSVLYFKTGGPEDSIPVVKVTDKCVFVSHHGDAHAALGAYQISRADLETTGRAKHGFALLFTSEATRDEYYRDREDRNGAILAALDSRPTPVPASTEDSGAEADSGDEIPAKRPSKPSQKLAREHGYLLHGGALWELDGDGRTTGRKLTGITAREAVDFLLDGTMPPGHALDDLEGLSRQGLCEVAAGLEGTDYTVRGYKRMTEADLRASLRDSRARMVNAEAATPAPEADEAVAAEPGDELEKMTKTELAYLVTDSSRGVSYTTSGLMAMKRADLVSLLRRSRELDAQREQEHAQEPTQDAQGAEAVAAPGGTVASADELAAVQARLSGSQDSATAADPSPAKRRRTVAQ